MGRRHWLDPLARRLLIATGQLPAVSARRPAQGALADGGEAQAEQAHLEQVERDLLALRLGQEPGRRLRDAEEVRRAAALGWRLDVNRATAADWLRLPGCSPAQADLLIRLQQGGIQLSGPEDLQRLLELEPATLQAWSPLLEFRWYGSPPLAAPVRCLPLNQAAAAQIEQELGLDGARVAALLRERARGPFRDLADLQQRLHWPASLIEALIGRVSFGGAGTGPELPPARRSLP
ncbi:MAG: hypothetical protein VKI83_00295 [Synechococcaceae cyanobacterium]|nr:hypothetical protein [Synechococcaceae cyanobacterium]